MPDKPDALTAAKAPPAPVQLGIRALSLGEAKILAESVNALSEDSLKDALASITRK